MREILFRGKDIKTNEWVYGYLYIHNGYSGTSALIRGDKILDTEVDPNTIGQYTGLVDKNGTKIFEGDIIRYPYTSYDGKHDDTYIVQFSRTMGCQYWLHNTKEDSKHGSKGMCKNSEKSYEVIGNIYDKEVNNANTTN